MAETAFTAIKSKDSEAVLDVVAKYFKENNLTLVEEKVFGRTGKYVNSPKEYEDLEEYQESEIIPYLNSAYSFTTNFDFYSDLKVNSDWCIIFYHTGLANLQLSIDEDLTKMLSKELNTFCVDLYQNTVVGQVIIRSFEKGHAKDLLFILSPDEIAENDGYFSKLDKYGDQNWSEEEGGGFKIMDYWDEIGFDLLSKDFGLYAKERRPMYLKGAPDVITEFLSKKQRQFYVL